MSLCSICLAVPFFDLPLSPDWTLETYGDDVKLVYYDEDSPILIGYHETLDKLFASAASCRICRIVSQRARLTLAALDESGLNVPRAPLRLCRLTEDDHGFSVIVPNKVHIPCSYALIVAHVNFVVDKDSPFASTYPGRPISKDPLDPSALELLSSCIRTCENDHDHKPQHHGPGPGRILKVTRPRTGPDMIRICNFTSTRYAALSHCWGTSKCLNATLANLQSLKDGILVSALSKTFQDAITITRHIGLGYLWIDSLCIIQDDEKDWEQESAKMASVYQDAYITIAATRAAGDADGFLGPRAQRDYAMIPTTVGNTAGHVLACANSSKYVGDPEKYVYMADEPLSERGWTLQERYLSHRIVHFGHEQTSFECRSHFLTEDGYTCEGVLNHVGSDEMSTELGFDRSARIHLWADIVEEYAKRNLSYASDKLPAFAGLAERFSYAFAENQTQTLRYVAGLWQDDLVTGLLWKAEGNLGCIPSPLYRAPTWSWASSDGIIELWRKDEFPEAELVVVDEICIKLQSRNPFGSLHGGYLKLSGLLLSVRLNSVLDMSDPRLRIDVEILVNEKFAFSIHMDLDYPLESSSQDIATMELHFLCLVKYEYEYVEDDCSNSEDDAWDSRETRIQGLLLQSQEGCVRNELTGKVFSRLSCLYLYEKNAREVYAMCKKENMQSVTLI